MIEKDAIREKLKLIRSKLSREDVRTKSAQIRELLFSLPEFQRAKSVSFYVAKENEVQTDHMIKDSLRSGKKVLIPITDKESGKLIFSELRDYDTELEPGAFGVLEPEPAYRRVVSPAAMDLIVVPGVAFDVKGHRLGRGKGYYDRFLSEVSLNKVDAQFIGLAYEFQVLKEIQHEHGDVPVHKIVTEKRIINCRVFG